MEIRELPESRLVDDIHNGIVTQCNGQTKMPIEYARPGERIEIDASESAICVWTAKLRWLAALKAKGVRTFADTPELRVLVKTLANNELAGELKFSIWTIYLADLKLRRNEGDFLAVLPAYNQRGGKGKSRIGEHFDDIIKEAILEATASGKPIVRKHVAQAVRARAIETGDPNAAAIRFPSIATVSRRIDATLSKYEICKLNNGNKAAEKLYRHAGVRVTAIRPLEVIEGDDIDAGVFLSDERTGRTNGRAFVTGSVDQCTGVPLGLNVGFSHRNADSAIACMLDAIHPKDTSLPEYNGNGHWVGYGSCLVNVLDNALGNHATELRRVASAVSQIIGFSRPYKPTDKSRIEHFNHIMKNQFLSRLKGWRGQKGDTDGVKEGIETASMSLQQFKRELIGFITREYLVDRGEDGYSPTERWNSFYAKRGPAIAFSREQLAFFRLVPRRLRFRASGGVLRLKLRYQSEILEEVRRILGSDAEILVRCDPWDLSYVIVQHPASMQFFRVPCVEPEYLFKGITERQQATELSYFRAQRIVNPSIPQIVAFREESAENQLQLSNSKRMIDRRRARVAREDAELAASITQIAPQQVKAPALSEIEMRIQQLHDIQLTAEDDWGVEGDRL